MSTPPSTSILSGKEKGMTDRPRKRKKPHFMVKSAHYSARVQERWRFPGGRHSPIRQQHRWKPPLVRIGYGSPRQIRGQHPSGVHPVVVRSIADLQRLDTSRQGALLARSLGGRKRFLLLQEAQKKGLSVLLNVKDVSAALAGFRKKQEERTQARIQRLQGRERKQAEKEKIAEKTAKKRAAPEKEGEKKGGKSLEGSMESVPSHPGDPSSEEQQKEIMEKVITKRQ